MSHAFVDQMMERNRAGELRSPVSETLDMHLVEFGRGEAVYEMPARADLGNPLGVIQGGVATALADAAMAAATTTILSDEEIQREAITTIDIFARFIRPVNAAKVEREAHSDPPEFSASAALIVASAFQALGNPA